jgi:hypothetical protein
MAKRDMMSALVAIVKEATLELYREQDWGARATERLGC